MDARKILVALSIFHHGNWNSIVNALNKKEYPDDYYIEKVNRELKCKTLTMLDPDYPEYLRKLYCPPIVLFYYGDISLIYDFQKCLGVVGTREPTSLGISKTEEIVKETCKKSITVSGMAQGVDRIAHLTAINNGGKTVAVLGSGIDVCYPTCNRDIYEIMKKDHLVISEYPGQSTPDASHFPIRNRLIAQFSGAVLVTEARLRSGSSITIGYALNYNRHVMCVPSIDFGNSTCNATIRLGAILVENAEQVIEMIE